MTIIDSSVLTDISSLLKWTLGGAFVIISWLIREAINDLKKVMNEILKFNKAIDKRVRYLEDVSMVCEDCRNAATIVGERNKGERNGTEE